MLQMDAKGNSWEQPKTFLAAGHGNKEYGKPSLTYFAVKFQRQNHINHSSIA
jgi:hypothetical protein